MKRTEVLEIKTLSMAGLAKKSDEIKSELEQLVIDKNMGKLKDLKSLFKKRKDRAQVLTILRQKQLLVELEPVVEEEPEAKEKPKDGRGKR